MPHLNENTRDIQILIFSQGKKASTNADVERMFPVNCLPRILSHKRSHYVTKQVIAFVLLFFQIKITHVKPKSLLPKNPQVLQSYCVMCDSYLQYFKIK